MALDLTLAFQDKKPIQTIASLSHTHFLLVNIPSATRRITVGCEAKKIFLSFSHADGAAKSVTDCVWIPSNTVFSMAIGNNIDSFAVVADSAASDVAIILEEV